LAGVTNYDDTKVKEDIAKKADAETMTTELGKKVDKVTGFSLVSDTEIERLSKVHNYDDTAITGRVSTAEGKIITCDAVIANVTSFGGQTLDVNAFGCTLRLNGKPTMTDVTP
jgi:hypothetical protein